MLEQDVTRKVVGSKRFLKDMFVDMLDKTITNEDKQVYYLEFKVKLWEGEI